MDICPVRAFEKVGFDLDECELYDKILRDKKFYDATGGGVTFTGGEPMIQIEALQRIIRLCKQGGIHVAVETSSMVSWDSFQKIVDLVDLFICDLKAVTNELHMEGTGESNRQIRSNLIRLFACRADSTWIRIPLIPGFNDTESEFSKIVRFLSGYHFERVEIMPYHDIGISKYDALGMVYPLKKIQPPSQLHIDELKNRLINGGVYNVS
jgi:pyruvate formate lyase activating enzyme